MGFIPHRTKASGAARGGMSSSPDTIMARLPPLTSMEAFLEVARHGTVKAAASELGLSMPALSRRIQTLEHAVGRQLFARPHHGLKLTEAGGALQVQHARLPKKPGGAISRGGGAGETLL